MQIQPQTESAEAADTFLATVEPRQITIRQLAPHTMIEASCRDCGAHHSYSAGEIVRQKAGRETVDSLQEKWRCWHPTCQGPLDLVVETDGGL